MIRHAPLRGDIEFLERSLRYVLLDFWLARANKCPTPQAFEERRPKDLQGRTP
jgi:hypothetical protein